MYAVLMVRCYTFSIPTLGNGNIVELWSHRMDPLDEIHTINDWQFNRKVDE